MQALLKFQRNTGFVKNLCVVGNSHISIKSTRCNLILRSCLSTFSSPIYRGQQVAFYAKDTADKGSSKSINPPTDGSSPESSSGSESDSESGFKSDGRSEDQVKQMRVSLMEAALKHVNSVGWSRQALALGAVDAGLPSSAHGLVERPIDFVIWFIRRCNDQLAVELQKKTKEMAAGHIPRENTTEFVKNAIFMRLDYMKPYLSSWPEALSVLLSPRNCLTACVTQSSTGSSEKSTAPKLQFPFSLLPPLQPLTLPEPLVPLGELVDAIWSLAGDRSVDFNWYSKRALLAYVYASSELYLLTDRSSGHRHTRLFVARRLDDVLTVGGAIGDARRTVTLAAETAAHLSQVLRNIAFYPRQRFA